MRRHVLSIASLTAFGASGVGERRLLTIRCWHRVGAAGLGTIPATVDYRYGRLAG
jgi:hypothetical protein